MIFQERFRINKKFKILGIEHVAVAVKSKKNIHNFFTKILSVNFIGEEAVQNENVNTGIYDFGNAKIETLESTNKDSVISKFIDKRGESIHHIALLVDNISVAIKYLKDMEVRLIYDDAVNGADNKVITFIHPHETPGLLIELCQKKNS